MRVRTHQAGVLIQKAEQCPCEDRVQGKGGRKGLRSRVGTKKTGGESNIIKKKYDKKIGSKNE